MPLAHVLERLIAGSDLTRAEARAAMAVLAEGDPPPEQVAGFLVALQCKGVRAAELAGLADALRERALALEHDHPDLVDTCGTGGGRTTFNMSTGAALVAAAAGARVAKHGNRSVTSACGSVDVLEALGIRTLADPERLSHLLDQTGIVFLFAPHHHQATKGVGSVRKALAVRTVFNLLGPLANPAGARRQLVGVYDRALVRLVADALVRLGAERAFVVHSEDGLDEVSPCAQTWYAEVSGGKVSEGSFRPADFGIEPVPQSSLACGDSLAENAAILLAGLSGKEPGRAAALVPNASLALLLSGKAADLKGAAALAREAIASGQAVRLVERLREATAG